MDHTLLLRVHILFPCMYLTCAHTHWHRWARTQAMQLGTSLLASDLKGVRKVSSWHDSRPQPGDHVGGSNTCICSNVWRLRPGCVCSKRGVTRRKLQTPGTSVRCYTEKAPNAWQRRGTQACGVSGSFNQMISVLYMLHGESNQGVASPTTTERHKQNRKLTSNPA